MTGTLQGLAAARDGVTLRHWIERWALETPSRTALHTPEGSFNFAALHRRASSLALFFQGLGLQRGDVIAAQLPNGPEFVLTYLAAGYIGAVLQTVHMPYRAAEIGPMLAHSGAAAFICGPDLKEFSPAGFGLSLRASLPSLRSVIKVGGETALAEAVAFPWLDDASSHAPPARSADAARFLLLYTSGTTARPKGVPIEYHQFLPNAVASARELGVDRTSILLSAAPFTHLYGLFSLNLAFATGSATAMLPSYSPQALADALDRHRPTGLFVAPAHMAACLAQGLLTRDRLASLRFVLISGSACPPQLAQAVQELMKDGEVAQLWGMSELQAGSFTRPGDDASVRFGSVGRASPGTELRVVPDDMPAIGEEGELQVRGVSVFGGYLENPEATAAAFTADGWFRTGDLAILDERGNVRLTGRSKDVVNRGGVKFNPADVEALIQRHPAVAECAIVPVPDPVLGERACCFAVLKAKAATLALDELCQWLAAHDIAKLKWPERLELIDEMPITPTRKIMKGELARRAAKAG